MGQGTALDLPLLQTKSAGPGPSRIRYWLSNSMTCRSRPDGPVSSGVCQFGFETREFKVGMTTDLRS